MVTYAEKKISTSPNQAKFNSRTVSRNFSKINLTDTHKLAWESRDE